MKRFVEWQDRAQLMRSCCCPNVRTTLLGRTTRFRVVDAFIEELDLAVLGFAGVVPEATGRPSYHPATLLRMIR